MLDIRSRVGRHVAAALEKRYPLMAELARDGDLLVVTPSGAPSNADVQLRTVVQFDGDIVITCRKDLADRAAVQTHTAAVDTVITDLTAELRHIQQNRNIVAVTRAGFALAAPPMAATGGYIPSLQNGDLLRLAGDLALPFAAYLTPEIARLVLGLVLAWLIRPKLRELGISI